MKLRYIILMLFLLVTSVLASEPAWLFEDDLAEWEIYLLDEEANEDKLFCRTLMDEFGNVIETRWYNFFTNRNDVVRIDEGNTTTPDCKFPQHEPVYASGSNKGKVYSRRIFGEEGEVIETIWYNVCSEEIEKRDDGDTTSIGSNAFEGKCYHPDYVIDEEEQEILEEEEKGIESVTGAVIGAGNKIVDWFKELFNIG